MFDYNITESGFAADIAFDKFWNVHQVAASKCLKKGMLLPSEMLKVSFA